MLRLLLIAAVALLASPAVRAQQAPDPPRGTLPQAIRMLVAEAEEARETAKLPRQETTFASEHQDRFDQLNRTAIARRLERPQHDDPFVDAYVRWQLTGFDPAFPLGDESEFDDGDFARLLDTLPPLVRNPRSEPALVASVNRLLARERISEAQADAVARTNRELRTLEAAMRNLSRPALQLRAWIEGKLLDHPARLHMARLNRLRALVEAGWGAERLKRDLDRSLEQVADDPAFSPAQRQALAARARQLIGLRTPIVRRVAAPDGVPQADFDETAVYDFEVSAWIRILAGR